MRQIHLGSRYRYQQCRWCIAIGIIMLKNKNITKSLFLVLANIHTYTLLKCIRWLDLHNWSRYLFLDKYNYLSMGGIIAWWQYLSTIQPCKTNIDIKLNDKLYLPTNNKENLNFLITPAPKQSIPIMGQNVVKRYSSRFMSIICHLVLVLHAGDPSFNSRRWHKCATVVTGVG